MALNEQDFVRLIKIGIDKSVIDDAKKKLNELSIDINKLSKVQKEQKGTVFENTLAYKQNAAELKALQKEERQQMEILKQANTVVRSQVGSENERAATLSILRAKHKSLSDEEKASIEIGGKLQTTIKELSDAQKKEADQLGQNYLNVGNYDNALKDLKLALKEAKNEMVGIATTLGQDSQEFRDAAEKAGKLKDQIDDVNTATKELSSGSNLGQFKSTLGGIGTSLKELDFAEAAEKAKRLADIAKAMTFSEMISGLKSLGSTLIGLGKALLTNPLFLFAAAVTAVGLVLKDLYDTNQNIIKSQGEVDKAITESKGFLKDYADKVQDAYYRIQVATGARTQAEVDALKATRDTDAAILKENEDFAKQVLASKERLGIKSGVMAITQSAEREALNKEIQQLQLIHEQKLASIQQAGQVEALAQRIENATAEKTAIDAELATTLADTQKFNDEKVAINKKAAEELVALTLAQHEKEVAAQLAADDLQEKYEQEHIAAENKAYVDANNAHIASADELFNAEVAHIQKRAEIDKTDAATQIKDKKDLAKKLNEITLSELEGELALMQQFSLPLTQPQLDAIDLLIAKIKQLKGELNSPASGAPTAAEALGLTPDDIKGMQTALQNLSQGIKAIQDINNAGYDRQINNLETLRLAEIQNVNSSVISQTQKDAQIKVLNKKFAQEKYQLEKKQFEANKKIAITQAIINTALGVVNAIGTAPNIIVGVILAALAAATGAAEIATISAQPSPTPPSFSKGTFLKDGQGTETSDDIPAYLSKNETVINAKSSKRFLPLLSKINQWGGGVAFANRGVHVSDSLVSRFAGGGISSAANQIFQNADAQTQLSNTINQIVPVLVLEEFQNVQGRQIRTATNLELS